MNKEIIISGIQQLGVGTTNVYESWRWYAKYFGMDTRVFEERAKAMFMLPYTGNQPQERHAALAVNLQGGGGFEIWQYTERTPQKVDFELQLGDLGIFAGKIKCPNVEKVWQWYKEEGIEISEISTNPLGEKVFFFNDPFGNCFEMVESTEWFSKPTKLTGGPVGAVIGSTNIDKALVVYQQILGFDTIVSDTTGTYKDFAWLKGGEGRFRRVILRQSKQPIGYFSRMFGKAEIELVQALDRTPKKIYEGRFWGDPGFIQLCFDIQGMDAMREKCASLNCPFTVDSSKSVDIFDMGEASGNFVYIEDPDGTLIEMVETYRIPIIKKLGWYIDLTKRDPKKPLPDWLLKAMRFNKFKG